MAEPMAGAEDTLSMIAYKGALPKLDAFLAANPGTDLSAKDEDERTPLHWAAAGGNLPVLQRLLHDDAIKAKCLNAQDEGGATPLLCAVAGGHGEAVAALLAAGANANKTNEQGCIPLHYHKGRAAMIEALLPHTRDVNTRDEGGVTPLHRAAGPGYIDAARALLAAGAAVNAADVQGRTPLHYACEEARPEVVSLLVDNGARADIKDGEGLTAEGVIPRGDFYARVRNTLQEALARARA